MVVLAPEDPLPLYCAACDVMLAAPSGALCVAAAVCGMPLVHLPAMDDFEAQTAQFFAERGMSLAGKDYEEAAVLALALAKDEPRKEAMRLCQQSENIPNAAQRIVRFLHEGRM